ncbi:MAG: HEPN domain-containing protein [Chitinophagaceae bacterium]
MNAAMHPLGACNNAQLQEIVNIIIKATAPEHIFLTGASFTRQQVCNIFSDRPACYQQVTHYELVVLLSAEEKRNIDEVQDLIENRCRAHTPVTALIFTTAQFNDLLLAGHPFCCEVYDAGLPAYNAGRTALRQPRYTEAAQLQASAREAFSKWHGMAEEFFAGAELYLMRKQFRMASFMLHQVAERCYVSIIQVITGYRAGTHNLEKLSRYAKGFSSELCLLFPRTNEKEEHLFRQLQKAYIYSRYKDDYSISEQDLSILTERMEKLLLITKQLCEAGIASIRNTDAHKQELVCIGRA